MFGYGAKKKLYADAIRKKLWYNNTKKSYVIMSSFYLAFLAVPIR